MPRVLIISYYFPPAGGPGVQRIMGLVRHLPSFGWEPVVLTVKGGTFFNRDEESLARVPASVPVYRTKAFEPFALYNRLRGKPADEALPIGGVGQGGGGVAARLSQWVRANLFVPDARIGWIPSAVSAAKRLVRHERIDAIITSSPPQTVHLIGRRAALATGLPWIADFRDPWTQIYYNS
ncbi:MAG TPA: glycosyl transferase family 1, partial [Candidatus Hydrogenedentes bacterium]|nr:glycosyl transferase family 1 [Candidatus Hydrogenedentota bacterium]